MSKKRVLGQGVEALLGAAPGKSVHEGKPEGSGVRQLPIGAIIPNPDQPRQKFDPETLAELADSIRQQGVIQPILAEERSDGTYMLVAGERRWRASQQAGLTEVPVIIRSFSREQKLEIALVENVQREDLTPLEEARAYWHLMDVLGLSQQDVADKVGKNRSTVANSLRLLKLPDPVKSAVEDGRLSAGHARALLAVTNPTDQERLFARIQSQGLSVREAEAAAADMNRGSQRSDQTKAVEAEPARSKDPDLARVEERFIEALGTKVSLRGGLSKGRIEISWFNRDDLDRIYNLIVREE